VIYIIPVWQAGDEQPRSLLHNRPGGQLVDV